jgi:hypothetical protein
MCGTLSLSPTKPVILLGNKPVGTRDNEHSKGSRQLQSYAGESIDSISNAGQILAFSL